MVAEVVRLWVFVRCVQTLASSATHNLDFDTPPGLVKSSGGASAVASDGRFVACAFYVV